MSGMRALSNDELRRVAPSIFATQPWSGVSERYNFIPTIEVVERLRKEGFVPTHVNQSRVRIAEKRGFTKHMIRFSRSEDVKLFGVVDGNAHHFYKEKPEVAQVTLVNAHDRSSSYQLDGALWRLVCSNGLMVSSGSIGSGIHVRHSGNVVEEVIEGSFKIIEEMPAVFELVGEMKSIPLTREQQMAFAKAAVALRWDTEKQEAPILPERLLTPRRYEDQGNDLWLTFNRVQENLLKGGIHGRSANRRRMTTRGVKGVNEDIRLNRALWTLAEELKKQVQ